MRIVGWALALLIVGVPWAGAQAGGNLAARVTELPELKIKGDLTVSEHEYKLETGKYYVWRISSDGTDEFSLMAPALMRNSWLDRVVIDDTAIEPIGGIYSVDFDNESTAEIWFVPIRPGRYEFWIDGYKSRGMSGVFLVN